MKVCQPALKQMLLLLQGQQLLLGSLLCFEAHLQAQAMLQVSCLQPCSGVVHPAVKQELCRHTHQWQHSSATEL